MPRNGEPVDGHFEQDHEPRGGRRAEAVPCDCPGCDVMVRPAPDGARSYCGRCQRVCVPACREAHRRMDGGAPLPPAGTPTATTQRHAPAAQHARGGGGGSIVDDIKTIAGFVRQTGSIFDELLGGGGDDEPAPKKPRKAPPPSRGRRGGR